MGGRIVPSRMKIMPSFALSGIVRCSWCTEEAIIDISRYKNCPITHIGEEHAVESELAGLDFVKESRLECYRKRNALTVL
jgi:hypothetical protein